MTRFAAPALMICGLALAACQPQEPPKVAAPAPAPQAEDATAPVPAPSNRILYDLDGYGFESGGSATSAPDKTAKPRPAR